MNRPQTRFWLPTWLALVAVVSIFLVLPGAAQIGASQDVGLCSGDTVLVFTDARLLNADGQNIGGPYALELPAGTYTVTAGSYDGHDGTQTTQPQEQWRVAANSGWLSPFTVDIADAAQTSITLFSNQIIPADVSSIELVHLGEGGVNSVSPVCVGFTRVDTEGESDNTNDPGDDSTDVDDGQTEGSDEPVEPDTDTGGSDDGGETDTADPDTDVDADPDSENPGSDDADNPADSADLDESDEPDSSDADADTATDSTDTDSDASDTNSTDTDTASDADGSSDTTTNAPTDGAAVPEDNAPGGNAPEDSAPEESAAVDDTAGDETIVPEVAGIVQEADTLAATGAAPITGRVLGLGMLLLGLGGLVVVLTERRSNLSG